MVHAIKKILKPIYRYWAVHLFFKSLKLGYLRFIYFPFNRQKYSSLKQYKNRHRGQRVFIIATGPSLTIEDVNLLKGEVCFGMNSIFKFFDYTDWRPEYYAIFDSTVYDRVKEDIDKVHLNCIFKPDSFEWKADNIKEVACLPNLCSTGEERAHYKRWDIKHFSNDISEMVYSGTSVVYFIAQICFYMGFDEIYLLGADCSNFGTHSKMVSYKDENKISGTQEDTIRGIMTDYMKIKEEADKRGIKVFNATRGGKLEIFPRVKLETII